ncbi:MAG: hypothetical protein WC539_07095 [Nitrospirota bacterium]
MKKKAMILFLFCFFFLTTVPQFSNAQSSQNAVHVINFPETQKVKGTVTIVGTTSHSKFIKKERVLVPTSRRNELSELTFAGILETDGFTSISANIQGEIKSGSFSMGTIGVLLIPDEEPLIRSFRDAKHIAFPIEAVATIKNHESPIFESLPTVQTIGFPRYRIFLYNTLNKSIEANVYLYLLN